jgi:hypothetical protein
MGSSVPAVGIQLNGAVVSAAHLAPEGASFADSQPIALTLRAGLNALRLVRPASAGQWSIESLTVTAGGTAPRPTTPRCGGTRRNRDGEST